MQDIISLEKIVKDLEEKQDRLMTSINVLKLEKEEEEDKVKSIKIKKTNLLEELKKEEVKKINSTSNEVSNLELIKTIIKVMGGDEKLITFVEDRKGHDRRYALSIDKIASLGWSPRYTFEKAMAETVSWYKDNRWWWEPLKSGEYLSYYKEQYKTNL